MFNLFPKKKSVDELIEDSKPKINITAEWNELLKEVLQLRHLKEENVKLIESINNLREQQNFLYKENEQLKAFQKGYIHERDTAREINAKLLKEKEDLSDRVNEIDNDVIRDLKDEIFVLKNDYAVLKEKYNKLKAQKHPMYPLHWGGLDPLIHDQAKDLTIEESIDKVKQKTPWVEEPIDWKGETEYDIIDGLKVQRIPYVGCACGSCEDNKPKEKSWEEASGDLALRVVKLEKYIERWEHYYA